MSCLRAHFEMTTQLYLRRVLTFRRSQRHIFTFAKQQLPSLKNSKLNPSLCRYFCDKKDLDKHENNSENEKKKHNTFADTEHTNFKGAQIELEEEQSTERTTHVFDANVWEEKKFETCNKNKKVFEKKKDSSDSGSDVDTDDEDARITKIPIENQPPWLLVDEHYAKKAFNLQKTELDDITHIEKPSPSEDGTTVPMWYKRHLWLYAIKKGKIQQNHPELTWEEQRNLYAFAAHHNTKQKMLKHRPLTSLPGGKAVRAALINNSAQFVLKLTLALCTRSSAIMAEAVHSFSDLVNQLLQRHSVLSSVAKPERKYPFGFGNVRYTYALISAQIMVGLGGFATWHGIVGLQHPEPIQHVGLGVAMCCVAAGLEMYSVKAAYDSIQNDAKNTGVSFKDYLKEGSDATSVHVFMEDIAGLGCAIIALGAVGGGYFINPIFDPIGSILIGGIVSSTGGFLFYRNFQLLIGKSLPEPIHVKILNVVSKNPHVHGCHNLRTVILGAQTVLVKLDVAFNPDSIVDSRVQTSHLRHEFFRSAKTEQEFHDLICKEFAAFHSILTEEKDKLEVSIGESLPFKHCYIHIDLY